MALETSVTYFADLNPEWPTSTDPKSAGDDNIRNLKTSMLNTFAGFSGAVRVTGTDGGAANAYTVTPSTALPSYSSRMAVVFVPTADNTGASTLNISGLGAKSVKAVDGSALVAGDLVAGSVYSAVYTGTEFRLLSVTKEYVDLLREYVDQVAFGTALPSQSVGFVISDGSSASFSKTHTGYAQNEVKGGDVASAATVDLTAPTGNFIHVTGTTTITAITVPSGAERTVVFDGALTLTHNASSLILPSGSNITTAAGDVMRVRGDGSGIARVVDYQRATGRALVAPQGLVLLAAITPTLAATVDALSVFTADYDNYIIRMEGILPTADDSVLFRFAVGGAVDSGSNYYSENVGTITATAATSAVIQSPGSPMYSGGMGLNVEMRIINANATTGLKAAMIDTVDQSNATPTLRSASKYTAYTAANAISGIRFLWSGGSNFAATGKIYIYGMANN